MNRASSSSIDQAPVSAFEQMKRDKAQADREISRLERELELVKGKSHGKIQSLEENLERTNLALSQLRAEMEKVTMDRARITEELSGLQDTLIDQENEMSKLRTRQRLIDAELAKKDKDAKQLLACVRRYKTRIEYLKSKMRRARRASKSDEEGDGNKSSLIGGASVGDESPYTASILTNGAGSSVVGPSRRDSIPFPGYMTAEEEYFRLVVLAAKLNVAGTTTPSTVDDPDCLISASQLDMMDSTGIEEVNEADIDPKVMYDRLQSEKIPFHKWHDWAQEYVVSHHMPALMGVDCSGFEKKPKKQGFARRVVNGGKKIKELASKMIHLGRTKKRGSIGIAAGGDGLDHGN
jgi:hypothetical protein